jgi:hypothetical protein
MIHTEETHTMAHQEPTITYGYIASRNHVNGKPEAVFVRVADDGHISNLDGDTIDQSAMVYATKEEALAAARIRWTR